MGLYRDRSSREVYDKPDIAQPDVRHARAVRPKAAPAQMSVIDLRALFLVGVF
jgi:hypothetical protein